MKFEFAPSKNIMFDYKKKSTDSFFVEEGAYRNITDAAPHAIEVLESLFDNAISLVEDCENDFGKGRNYIYGGVLRDLIAELPITEDLDILSTYGMGLSHLFSENPKWSGYAKEKQQKSSRYDASVYNYINFDQKQVDIIHCADILKHVLNSDLLCCCLLMDLKGQIYEMVEGALTDCQTKVLRINPLCKNLTKENLLCRIEKLEKRGWTSTIDLNTIKETEPQDKQKEKQWKYTPFKGDRDILVEEQPVPIPAPEEYFPPPTARTKGTVGTTTFRSAPNYSMSKMLFEKKKTAIASTTFTDF